MVLWGHLGTHGTQYHDVTEVNRKSLLSPCVGHCDLQGGHLVWSRFPLRVGLVQERMHFPAIPPRRTIRKTMVVIGPADNYYGLGDRADRSDYLMSRLSDS